MDTNESTLRAIVSEKRAQRGWTLRDLSERSGVSPATIMRFEKGADATLSNVESICGALGMHLGDLTEVRREELRRSALAKLTAEEAAALGVSPRNQTKNGEPT